jgi:hypothetical protein
MEARLEVKEPTSLDTTPEVADDQEIPVEDAARMPAGEPKKRRRDGRNLAAVRRRKNKDRVLDARRRGKEQGWAQRKNGCLKNLIAARRGATRRAAGVRHRILSTKDNTWEYCGPRKGSVAARRGMTCRAVVARRRILFTETTRSGLIVAVREVTHCGQVARRNGLPRKDTTREHRESRKKLAADGRKETRRAKVAWQKRNFVGRNRRKEIATGGDHTKDKVE